MRDEYVAAELAADPRVAPDDVSETRALQLPELVAAERLVVVVPIGVTKSEELVADDGVEES